MLPGFIDLNALGDVDHTILKFDLPPEVAPSLVWSERYLARDPRDVFTAEETAEGACFALAQLLLNGITTVLPVTSLLGRAWAEGHDEFAAMAEIAAALGLRTYLGPSYRSAVHVMRADGTTRLHEAKGKGAAGLAAAERFIDRHRGSHGGLVQGLLVPSTIETCSDELLAATREAAERLGVPFRLHCCQSAREVRSIHERSGRTPFEHLDALGLLRPGALLPHAVELGGPAHDPARVATDLDRLVQSGTTIVYCPLVMARRGRALRTFAELWARGASIGLGTDTAAPDLIQNLQVGLLVGRVVPPATSRVSCGDHLRAATLGGARALGRDDLGRLAPGAKADIAVVDLADPRHGPIHDPVQALFLTASGRDVRQVVVDGRHVVVDGQIPGFDLDRSKVQAQAPFSRMVEAYGERDAMGRSADQLFPSSFPTINTATAPSGRPTEGHG